MRRLRRIVWVVALLLAFGMLSEMQVNAQQRPDVSLTSQYIIGRYGYGVINETITFHNNSTSPVSIPSFRIGFSQDIARLASYYNATSGFRVYRSDNLSMYHVSPEEQTLQAGAKSVFMLKLFLPNIVKSTNTSIYVYLMLSPSINLSLSTSKLVIKMPASTQLKNVPSGYGYTTTGTNTTYYRDDKNVQNLEAKSTIAQIQTSNQMDFHPLTVFYASRIFSLSNNGQLVVTDSITFRNNGVTTLTTLTVSPLARLNSRITIVASSQPPLINPVTLSLSGYGIPLSASGLNSPVAAGTNYTISYSYVLDSKYISISGDTLTISVPYLPPIPTTVEKYTIATQTQPGVRILSGQPLNLQNVNIFSSGYVNYKLEITVAWSADYFIPLASLVFLVLLFGFVAVKGQAVEEEEKEPVENISSMIKAFEEKNSVIVSALEEMKEKKEGKTYFDEVRSRIDAFRNRAIQRLGEAKQSTTSQDIAEVLNMIQNTEREVDRAAKDLINLYEQYSTNRINKETFERLMPSYRKRLDRSLNILSDLLNEAQRQSKQA